MLVQDVLQWLDGFAPFDTCESFDNCGLLIGNAAAQVSGVHFCLDATPQAVEHAVQNGANLLVTHHPIVFHPLKRVDTATVQGSLLQTLLQHSVSVISAHTNLDKAPGGISDALAEALQLSAVTAADDYIRIGELPKALSVEQFSAYVAQRLHTVPRVLFAQHKQLHRIAVAGGAYGEGYEQVIACGADAFVVGEIKHHEIMDACARNLVVADASHYATEQPGVEALHRRFLNDFPNVISAAVEKQVPYRALPC